MKNNVLASSLLAAAALGSLLPACIDPVDDLDEAVDVAEVEQPLAAAAVVTDDNLNGLWDTTVDGVHQDDTVIESWTAIGIRIHVGASVYQVSRSGDTLSGAGVSLQIDPNGQGVKDDGIDGTIGGRTFHMVRDVATKPSITLAFPGDRPFRVFLTDTITPLAQQDRESYIKLTKAKLGSFLTSCELYRHGSWLRQYMKGTTWAEQNQSFWNMINAANGIVSTPRALIGNVKFQNAVKANLKDPSLAGLALSSFSMYFSTGAGRALRMPITDDAMAYFITDRPSRAEKIGLVVMDTPTHSPLASTFGRQLLDLGEMPAADSPLYARTMMELLAKSDNRRAAQLSDLGKSALIDWYAVMAIEDYRGMSFGFPDLGWGYNMTNVQFYGLVARTLARPGAVDSDGNPVVGQVIVGGQLRPGEASYADVLNNGNDMQEYDDMARLKRLATSFLRATHPAVVNEVEAAFAGIVPKNELPDRARRDIFHFVTAQLYDTAGRTANLRGAAADRAVDAVVALFDTLSQDSAAFEQYIVQSGYAKSNVAAPKSTGF